MTKESINRLRRIYGIALSAVIVIAGICLMAACYGIYRSGDDPFSRESVAAAFSKITIPVYLCLVLVIGGFILALIFPNEAKKPAPKRQTALILRRLQDKTDLSDCDEALQKAVLAQRGGRKRNRIITSVLLAAGSVIFLIYALNLSHFTMDDINGSMIKAMSLLLPCMAVPFAYAVFTVYSSKKSMETEIALLKEAHAPVRKAEVPTAKPDRLYVLRYAVLAAGVVLLIYGYVTGGTADVLTKAINICTECVGLG